MAETESVVSLPASWYPDPDASDHLRWWNGESWTEHVQQLPPPPGSQAHGTGKPAEAFIIKTQVAEAGTWWAETGSKHLPHAAEPEAAVAAARESAVSSPSSWTGVSWLLALLPVLAFGLQFVLATIAHGEFFANSPLFFWLVPALFVIVNPFLAALDRGTLVARDIRTAPNGIIGLVPPLYLLLRAMSVGRSSVPALLIWCVSALAIYQPMRMLVTGFLLFVSTH